MKTFLKVFGFLVGYLGYALFALTIYAKFEGEWFSELIYGAATVIGFGLAFALRDDNSCPCCDKKA